MNALKIKIGTRRYRSATRDEILDAAAGYHRDELCNGAEIRSAADTENLLQKILAGRQHEQFVVIFLDNRHRVLDCTVMFEGTIDGTSVYPREVVRRSLEIGAAAVILAHNHPSGVAEPSQADERITRRLKSALELVDIRLLDHLVVGGGNRCTSLASRGLL